EAAPARVVETERPVLFTTSRVGTPFVRAAVAEHRACGSARRLEQVERPAELCEVLLPMLRLAEPQRAPAAGQHEPVPLEPRPQLVAVPEVARRAELDPFVAGRRNLCGQLVRARHVRQDADGHLDRPYGR